MTIYDDNRYNTRANPLLQEAAFIADNLDYGDPRLAVERLQRDLQALRQSPEAQLELVKLVNAYDRNGAGTDLQVRRRDQDGYVFADLVIVESDYRNSGYQGRQQQAYRLGSLFVGEDPRYSNYYSGADPRYRQDPRSQYDPRYGNGSGYYPDSRYVDPRYAHQRYVDPRYADQRYADPRYGYDGRQAAYNRNTRQPTDYHRRTQPQVAVGQLGLTRDATMALYEAQQNAARYGINIQVTSGLRSTAEQARLYRQLAGRRPVAEPGTSNHERGIAIDVKNYNQAKPFLQAAGFTHGDGKGPIRNDPYHFKYVG